MKSGCSEGPPCSSGWRRFSFLFTAGAKKPANSRRLKARVGRPGAAAKILRDVRRRVAPEGMACGSGLERAPDLSPSGTRVLEAGHVDYSKTYSEILSELHQRAVGHEFFERDFHGVRPFDRRSHCPG